MNILKAHYCARKAENLMRIPGSELECLKYLDKCVESLDIALTKTSSSKAIESIKLQRDHHVRQRELLQFHIDKFRRNEQKPEVVNNLNDKVIHAFKSHNDLFENIKITGETLEELETSEQSNVNLARLLELNTQLHGIISHLVNQVDETVIENEILRGKIQEFETRVKLEDVQQPIDDSNFDNNDTNEEFAPLDLPKFEVP